MLGGGVGCGVCGGGLDTERSGEKGWQGALKGGVTLGWLTGGGAC